jgi:hypothetical protein
VIGLAYVMSVPWYRETGAPLRIWFGLPDWVAVALFCYVAVAVFNAVAWSLAEVSDTPDEDDTAQALHPPHPSDASDTSESPAPIGHEAAR